MLCLESDDRGITRELVSPSLGEARESRIGVVQFVQSQPQDAGLSDSDIYWYYIVFNTHDFTRTSDIREVRRLRGSAGALSGEDRDEVVGPGLLHSVLNGDDDPWKQGTSAQ